MSKIFVFLAAMFFAVSANAFFQCVNNNTGDSVVWSVGQPKPSMNIAGPSDGISCAASGNELAYIHGRFTGIPMRGNGNAPVIWRGQSAVFILDNL